MNGLRRKCKDEACVIEPGFYLKIYLVLNVPKVADVGDEVSTGNSEGGGVKSKEMN